jgi:dihydrofolate reductase
MISLLVAVSENQVIGVNNQLPWHLPNDLKYFKKLTTGHTIIMGRKTFDSIGKPLPNRTNVVITRNKQFHVEGIICKHSITEALEDNNSADEVFIIGGDTIYKQSLAYCDRVYLTRVHTIIANGDAFFPELKLDEWKLTSSEEGILDEKNILPHTFEIYDRIKG